MNISNFSFQRRGVVFLCILWLIIWDSYGHLEILKFILLTRQKKKRRNEKYKQRRVWKPALPINTIFLNWISTWDIIVPVCLEELCTISRLRGWSWSWVWLVSKRGRYFIYSFYLHSVNFSLLTNDTFLYSWLIW